MSAPTNASRNSLAHAKRQGAHVDEMQRRRLLHAIGELLAEGGVELATVGSISQRASVSRRTFYEIFDDREACLLAAFDQATERMSNDVAPAYTSQDSWSTGIRAGLTALLDHLDAHPGVARMCVMESLRAGPEMLERRKRVLATLARVVDKGREEVDAARELLPLTAEGVVGGALAVLHARLVEDPRGTLSDLADPLAAMILNSYIGSVATRRELNRPLPVRDDTVPGVPRNPFEDLSIRFTYRTARVIATISANPAASNRLIADGSGISDEGQMSRLLRRLQRAALIENHGEGHTRGEPNAWQLTPRGEAIQATLAGESKPKEPDD